MKAFRKQETSLESIKSVSIRAASRNLRVMPGPQADLLRSMKIHEIHEIHENHEK